MERSKQGVDRLGDRLCREFMIAIRLLELTKPIEAPTDIENKEAVRFYCSLRGQYLGHFTIWNKRRPIGRSQLLQELCQQLGQPLLKALFSTRFDGDVEPWWNLQRLIGTQLGAEAPQFWPEVLEEKKVEYPDVTVSINIPTRDRPHDLQRCLTSLLSHKTRFPVEIVVADNNPASGLSEPVARSFPGVVYVPEPRPGVSFARNAAALHSSGDIIVTTDDDVVHTEGWLDNLIAPYLNPEVMAVTGMVLPVEMEHIAQYWFEVYGGLTRVFERRRYDREYYDNTGFMPMVPAWDIGCTANASFRKEVFSDPVVGPFCDDLRASEDVYMFYRLIKANRVIVYEPSSVVQHRHRTSVEAMSRQLYSYGHTMFGMQLRTYFVDKDQRGVKSLWHILMFDRQRMVEIVQGKRNYPLKLVVAETRGHLAGPYRWLKSLFEVHTKLGHYTPEQFALAQAAREREKMAQAEKLRELVEAIDIKQLSEPDEARYLAPREAEDTVLN